MDEPTDRNRVFAGTRWNRRRLDDLAARLGGSGVGRDSANEQGNGADESVDDDITVVAPAVDEPLGTVPRQDERAVDDAVARCRAAAADWRDRPAEERAAVLDRFAGLVEKHRAELTDLVQLETGKARSDVVEETLDVPATASYYADRTPELGEPDRRAGAIPLATTAHVEYEPVGVVGVISPWNYPMTLSVTDAIAAIAAGNGVVLKPDEKTPFVAARLAELFVEAGLPEDVLTLVTGDGPVVGGALIDRVDYLTFTGSTETGRVVAEQAGRNLVDCSLELSGKNPMIVCPDADPERAARGAVAGAFANAGQLCLAIERISVVEPQFEAFLDAFVDATEALDVGLTYGFGPDVGSLIGPAQRERVESHVADARERGATVRTGGNARPDVGPYVYEPTVLTDLPDDSRAACEETFGPVVAVESVPAVEAAIEAANDTTHGLNASVWTGDRERGKRIASELAFGTVCVNDAYVSGWAALDALMGGVGDSGIGRRHGPEGLDRYLEPRTVATSRIGVVDAPPSLPTKWFVRGLDAISSVQRRLRRRF